MDSYNVSFIANGISRDTAGGASVNMDDDIVGKGQQEILTFYSQSELIFSFGVLYTLHFQIHLQTRCHIIAYFRYH